MQGNKTNELNVVVEDVDPKIFGKTVAWANKGTACAELGLIRYIMFRGDQIERREGSYFILFLFFKECIQA